MYSTKVSAILRGDTDFFRSNPLKDIKHELTKKTKKRHRELNLKAKLTFEEVFLIEKIRECTEELNKNNVTRTNNYLDFYIRHQEIHWALLGHLVSRNGGWNMTDLQGELLSNLLSEQERQDFFSFLERGNWLIFQDIYPQFLLYEESLKRNKKPLLPLVFF